MEEKRDKIKRVVINVLIVIMVSVTIICVYMFYQELKELDTIKKNHKTIINEVKNNNGDGIVDFKKLNKINPDIIAWISIPGTPVDYPVVMAKSNNDYYLKHDINGDYTQYGSIFTDCRLYGSPLEQKNCIIYGHNMGRWTNVMFSSLMKYEKQKYYDEHKSVFIYTKENGRTEYSIISVKEVDYSSYTYNIIFNSEKKFREWLKKSISDSIIECDFKDISKVNRVVTLSTCTYGTNKLVLVCVPNK